MAVSTIERRRAAWLAGQESEISAVTAAGIVPAPLGGGNGKSDDTTIILNAIAASGGTLRLPMGRVFFVTADFEVPHIIAEGGRLKPAAGVKISFGQISGADNAVVFEGEGIASSMSGTYSVGWYAGANFNEKRDFMRRAWITNGKKVAIIPYPAANDPAASFSVLVNSSSWKVVRPVILDDPDNFSDWYQYGALYAATPGMECILKASPLNKSEDINWLTPCYLDGGNNAVDCLRIHAGARIQFREGGFAGRARRDGVNAVADLAIGEGRGLDQLLFGAQWTCTDCGRYGMNIEGTATNAVYGLDMAYVFNNGAKGLWGTVTVVDGAVTAVAIDQLGPNGKAQVMSGHGFPGQVLAIHPRPGGTAGVANSGAGLGATGTFRFAGGDNAYGTPPIGVTLTASGSNYVNGEKVFMTSAEAVIRWAGPLRAPKLDRMLENQDDNSNLVSIFGAYLLLEATAAGSPRGMDINNIQTIQGRRPAVITRDTSGGKSSKFSGSIRGWNVPNPIPGQLHQLELGYWDDLKVYDPPAAPPNTRVINVDRNGTVNARFHSIPREWVSGNGDNYFFDGARILYSPGLADGEVMDMAVTLANVAIPLGTIDFITGVDNVTYRGQIARGQPGGVLDGTAKFVDGDKGSLVDMVTVQLSSGVNGGAAGRVTLFTYTAPNGTIRMGLKNLLGSSLRCKLMLTQ